MKLLFFLLTIFFCFSHLCVSETVHSVSTHNDESSDALKLLHVFEDSTTNNSLENESSCINGRCLKSKKTKKRSKLADSFDDEDIRQYIRNRNSSKKSHEDDDDDEKEKKVASKSDVDDEDIPKVRKRSGKFLRKEKSEESDEEEIKKMEEKLALLKKKKEAREKVKKEDKDEDEDEEKVKKDEDEKEKEEKEEKEEDEDEDEDEKKKEKVKRDEKEEEKKDEEEMEEEKVDKEDEKEEEKEVEEEKVEEEREEEKREKVEEKDIDEEKVEEKPENDKEEEETNPEETIETEETEETIKQDTRKEKLPSTNPPQEPEEEEPTFSHLSFNIETEDNKITIFPNLALVPSMKIACVIVVKGAPAPKQTTMMNKIDLFGQTVITEKDKNRIVLKTNDIHSVNSVVCMGYNKEENTYYGPTEMNLFVKPPPAPEIDVRVIELTSISVEIVVKSNIECRLWCTHSDAAREMTVSELKELQYRYVRERSSIYFTDLISNQTYAIWCYAETKEGVAMKESLQEKKQIVKTKEILLKVDDIKVTKSSISFVLLNNINREKKCSLIDSYGDIVKSASITIFSSNHVQFTGLRSHSPYYLNCQVFSKKSRGSGDSMVLAETKPIEIVTNRNVLKILFVIMVIIMVICIVLLVGLVFIRNYMENVKLSGDDSEKQALLPGMAEPGLIQPISTSSPEETWRCTMCQYLNRGNGDRCSMCKILRSGIVVTDMESIRAEEAADQPIVKKSSIGVGMKLSKPEKRSVNVPKKVMSTTEMKVETSDIFSEVGLGVKVDVGNRSATMLNKSMVTSTRHVSPSTSPANHISDHEGVDGDFGNGWDDDDLDLYTCLLKKDIFDIKVFFKMDDQCNHRIE